MKESANGKTPKTPEGATPTDEKLPDGQFKDHWVLSAEERAKGFVRPVREKYIHLVCGTVTRMGLKIAETYAAKPSFYGLTFCVGCKDYFSVGEHGQFVWDGSDERVGT